MVKVDINEFLDFTGINLDSELESQDDDINKSLRQLERWARIVYRETNRRSLRPIPSKNDLTEIQINAIKEAICEYGAYELHNRDLFRVSGYDRNTNTMININDLNKARFPEHITDILHQVGLIKKSMGVRIHSMPDYEGWF